jgi:hypothetical protein
VDTVTVNMPNKPSRAAVAMPSAHSTTRIRIAVYVALLGFV